MEGEFQDWDGISSLRTFTNVFFSFFFVGTASWTSKTMLKGEFQDWDRISSSRTFTNVLSSFFFIGTAS